MVGHAFLRLGEGLCVGRFSIVIILRRSIKAFISSPLPLFLWD